MYVKAYKPESGKVYFLRELAGDEIMDAQAFADQIAQDYFDSRIDDSGGFIPNCCGDIRIEFMEDPENDVHIWSGESFHIKED